MTNVFRGWRVEKDEATGKPRAPELVELGDDDLDPGEVVVVVTHSSINYKDALAMTGRGRVIRRFPMTPGIDLVGTVHSSEAEGFTPGDAVVLNGRGIGEAHHGAYAERARVPAEGLLTLPAGLSPQRAAAIGTAGVTAMLCILALEDAGLGPGAGPVLVTGASGGVGSVAVAVLAKLGHEVLAVTGRPQQADYLRELGASAILDRADFAGEPKPLGKERFAFAVDVAGGKTLANVLSMVRYGGAVAACGLADDLSLPTSVAPFILRGVSLLGVDSVMVATERRRLAWERLTSDLTMSHLDAMTSTVALDEVPEMARRLLDGEVRGRVVVAVGG